VYRLQLYQLIDLASHLDRLRRASYTAVPAEQSSIDLTAIEPGGGGKKLGAK